MGKRLSGLMQRRSGPTVALAGAGYISVVHAIAAQAAGMKVTAVASRSGTTARHFAGQIDARKVSPDTLPAGADILVVATPPRSHAPTALRGLRSGARVLVEKPIAATLADADSLVAAAAGSRGAGARLVCGENLLHAPIWKAAMQLRPSLGTLSHLSLETVQPPPDWGHFTEPLQDGGVLFDLGPHPVALALGLADESPVAVSAELSSGRPDGADDQARVKIRFPSGLVADLTVTWTAEDPHWGAQAASDTGVLRIELVPETVLEFNGDEVSVDLRHQVPDARIESMGYVDQLLDLASDDELGIGQSAGAARDVLEIIYAAYASAGAGGVEVPLPYEGDRTTPPLRLWQT